MVPLQEAQAPLGFTMLDGTALVLGAAVSAVHLRPFASNGLWGGDSSLFWPTFLGVGLTASGPFVLLERWFGRRSASYPHLADHLWAILGLPWVLTSVIRAATRLGPGRLDLYRPALSVLIGLTCAVTLAAITHRWILRSPSPEHASEDDLPGTWTARVGMAVSVAWPLQCGFGMVVTSSE